MTPATIKKHLKIAEEILSKEIDDLFTIRDYYFTKLCNEAKNYLKTKSETDNYSVFLKKIGFSKEEIELDNLIYEQCIKSKVHYKHFISSTYVPDFLNISKYEYKKMLSDKTLIPKGYDSMRLYGKEVKIPYFSILYLANIFLNKKNDPNINLKKIKRTFNEFSIDKEKVSFNYSITNLISVTLLNKYETLDNYEELLENIKQAIENINKKKRELDYLDLKCNIDKIMLSDNVYIDSEKDILTNQKTKKIFNFSKKHSISFNQAKSIANLNLTPICFEKIDILKLYPAMNNVKRKFKFILGPTNSGKTHEAIEVLKEAETGIYLGPLRILAHEKYEELKKSGINVSLITGEQKILSNNATHISSTIETLNPDEKYDIGIIDEIQMIDDFERGRYWLKSILALNCDTIYILGSENFNYYNFIISILDKYNISYEIEIKERLSKLSSLEDPVSHKELQKGDAIVAFDKNTLFLLAEELENKGKKVSLLFGDLPYDRKIVELNNFKNGKTEILIATDSIAMGINLPIKRILFYKLYKYNIINEAIDFRLFNQIIGRAGRYKEDGCYGVYISKVVKNQLHPEDLKFLLKDNNRIFYNLKKHTENNTFNNIDYFKFNYFYDNYLLKKIHCESNNFLFTIKKYDYLMPFNKNKNYNLKILEDIVKKSDCDALFYIMSLSPENKIFEYESVHAYKKNFNSYGNELFVDEKITSMLKLKSLNYEINTILQNKDFYKYDWSFYARDLSFNYNIYDE